MQITEENISVLEMKKPESNSSGLDADTAKRGNFTVSDGDNFTQAGTSMLNNGFISLPRALLQDPLWRGANIKHQHIFLVVLELVCYRPQKFNDHGKILNLKPGQVCISERELLKHCGRGISRNDIQSAIKYFKLVDFFSQEVSHIKNVITISHRETYELIKNASEPRFQPTSSQLPAIKEESNKVINRESKDSLKKKSKKEKSEFSDLVHQVAAKFLELMKSAKVDWVGIKPGAAMNNFLKSIRLMLEEDTREPSRIYKTLEWSLKDDFWRGHMFKPNPAKYLREKFDQLEEKSLTTPPAKRRGFGPASKGIENENLQKGIL